MQIPPMRVHFSEEDRREILQRIDTCLKTGQVAQGPNVQEIEDHFAGLVGVRHAVAVSSGGAAIQVAMRILGVRDKLVLAPTNTFLATVSGVLLEGGRVKLVDVSRETFSPSLATLQAAWTDDTAGVILVHVGGIITPEIERIRQWCDSKGIWLFEDCAHAHGSRHAGVHAGRFGRAAAFSFFATKVVTSGEGGMIVTDDDAFAQRARRLRDYGKESQWITHNVELGANWRMSELCAAVGLVHLRSLQAFIDSRSHAARIYTDALAQLPEVELVLPQGVSSWYKYIVLLPPHVDRDDLKQRMQARGVRLSGGVYDTPLHRQPVFAEYAGHFPVADDVCRRHICLPLYHEMREDEARYVVEVLSACLEESAAR